MRALRVLGIAENGAHVVCVEAEHDEDTAEGPAADAETFTLPLDDRLRAAVRGDLSRFGQLEIEMEPQLRPREIQSRIRAGASVEQVAAAAGCTPERIERYAYPVLMERSTITDRGRSVRPLQGASLGSAGASQVDRTLEEIVTGTLAGRGQRPEISWDAFRDERGWTVTATWYAGRSENRAEWAYHAGPDGGTVTPRNQAATDVLDPEPRPLRTIGDGHRTGGITLEAADSSAGTEARPGRRARPGRGTSARSGLDRSERLAEDTVTDQRSGALPPAGDADSGPGVTPEERTGTEDPSRARSDSAATGPSSPSRSASQGKEREQQPAGRAARRGHRPPMPSWEDVLLGTRASGR